MKTKRYRQWAFGALMAIPAMAMAAVSAEEAAELGKSLTPVGAERAGNADGPAPRRSVC